jgi:NifU-like protein
MSDVKSKDGQGWFYSEKVKDHFFNPRNILKTKKEADEYSKVADGEGEVGSPACGDVMKIWIKVKDDKITECKYQTFGCASAIASTSMFSTMVIGLKIEKALKITPKDIVNKLHGLPANKFHCSVLADQAFKKAVENYSQKTNLNSINYNKF